MTTAEIWTVVTGVGALAVAVAAGVAGWFAWAASWRAAEAATAMTTIENRRWHADMTPQLEITCTPARIGGQIGDRALLRVRFTGPPALHKLTITPTIRDDWPDRRAAVANGPTQEEIDAQIWGPYRFVHGVDGGSEDGRTVAPFTLLAGDGRGFALTRTLPPRWVTDGHLGWRQKNDGAPVRLALHCVHEDDAPWTVHLEVPVDEPGQG